MNLQKEKDLKRLKKLAFRRMSECAKVVEMYHSAPERIRQHPQLQEMYEWMFVPFSLWPFDISGAVSVMIGRLSSGRQVDKDFQFLFGLLGDLPHPGTCETISEYEHQVKGGNYESLIKAQHKFDLKEKMLAENSDFRADWNAIKYRFDVSKFQSETGIIRRRMVSERNFRPQGWDFKWRTTEDRFKLIFDAFCHKWVLYGMEFDKPLLQKLSVNITPFGTMIFIPRYWSLDHNRDLRWPEINNLHHSRGIPRQGQKLSASQIERTHQAADARRYWKEATQAGLKGEKRVDLVLSKLGWHPDTDPKQLRRLLKFAVTVTSRTTIGGTAQSSTVQK
jgi:hypothetical protein